MDKDPKKQRIYLNLGSECENKVLEYDFLKPLINYFEKKGWKFKLHFFSKEKVTSCSAYFEKESEVKK